MENLVLLANSVAVVGGLGFVFGIGLGLAAKKFAIQVDPREEELLNVLPNANCGACGFTGCRAYAEALLAGKAKVGQCPVAGGEATAKIARIMGQELSEFSAPKVAVIFCDGGSKCKDKYEWKGVESCALASKYFGGPKECEFGCLGLGDCFRACPFGAIKWEKPGEVPIIDWEKCTGCGLCVSACPKNIIHLVDCRYRVHIRCASTDRGARVRQICPPGCIGCGLCVKVCPKNDIIMENNLAKMKYDTCDNCGLCEAKCPTKTIKIRQLVGV